MRFPPGVFNYTGAVSPCSSLIPFSVSFFTVPLCVSVSCIALRFVRAVLPCVSSRLSRALPCSHPCLFFFHRAFSGTWQSRRIKQGRKRRRPEARMRAIGRSTKRR